MLLGPKLGFPRLIRKPIHARALTALWSCRPTRLPRRNLEVLDLSWRGKAGDVYIACRRLGNALKLSLHESGHWHVAFDSKAFSQMFEGHNTPPDRLMGRWERPAPIIDGLTLACRIHIPGDAATIPEPSLDSKVHWIACAPPGQSVEVAVFLSDHLLGDSDWPGRNAMQTKLVGHLSLDGGGYVYIVHHTCATIEQPFPPPTGYFKGRAKSNYLLTQTERLGGDRWMTARSSFRRGRLS